MQRESDYKIKVTFTLGQSPDYRSRPRLGQNNLGHLCNV